MSAKASTRREAGARTPERTRTLRAQIGPFAMVPVWLLDLCQDSRAIHLYALLGKYANREGRAWPKRTDLAAAMQVSVKSVERATEHLRAIGALRTYWKRHRNGAVAGMDFLLVQIDPRQSDTGVVQGRGKKRAGQPESQSDTGVAQSNALQSDTGVVQATVNLSDTGVAQESTLTDTGVGPRTTPVSITTKEEPDPVNQIQEPEHGAPAAPRAARSLLDDYAAGFTTRFTTDPLHPMRPAIVAGKDAKLLRDLAESHSEAVVRQLLDWFFRTPDPWIRQTGYTVGVFKACFNQLLLTYRPADPPVSERTATLRAIRAKREAELEQLEADARTALIAMPAAAGAALRERVLTDFRRDYPGLEACMRPEEFAKAIKRAMVAFVVTRVVKERQTITEALAPFTQEPAA